MNKGSGNAAITVSATPNTASTMRSARFVISSDAGYVAVRVNQQGAVATVEVTDDV